MRLFATILSVLLLSAQVRADRFSSKTEVIDAAKVPKQIISNFELYYPAAKVIRWEKEKTTYKVYVINEKVKEIALFKHNGDWLQTEQVIRKEQLPLKVNRFIEEKFPLYAIGECFYVSYTDDAPSCFLVYIHLKLSKDYIRPLLFDITGTIKRIDGLEISSTDQIEAARPSQESVASITAGKEVVRISDVIMKELKKRFPRAEKISWEKQGNDYVAELTNYDQQIKAAFFENGMQIYTSYPFFKHDMPFPIQQYFKNEDKKYKFVEGRRVIYESKYRRSITEGEKPRDFYEVIMSYKKPKSKNTEFFLFHFNQNGQFDFQTPYNP
ncbi:MAG: hypothetical protein LBQ31_02110 [Bacteroidales bacterium]|jgi:hypothetical protein|nr:hypothetical protein [Bacteroidales bacterium]